MKAIAETFAQRMDVNKQVKASTRARGRPAQALYMPPAQRNRERKEEKSAIEEFDTFAPKEESLLDMTTLISIASLQIHEESVTQRKETQKAKGLEATKTKMMLIDTETNQSDSTQSKNTVKELSERTGAKDMLQTLKSSTKTQSIKSMDVKCDVLHQSAAKNVKKSPIKLVQVDQWEDLFNDDENDASKMDAIEKSHENLTELLPIETDIEEDVVENQTISQLEHVLEIYDFPSNFRTADIMKIYSEMDQNSMYIKWLNDTHALLVLGSELQAKRALQIASPLIKSRPLAVGSSAALTAVKNCNLPPAMKRPQTSMHAARRMITTALGAKANVSQEVQERERETLRKAKELRRTKQQSERDAWDGNPRPTSA